MTDPITDPIIRRAADFVRPLYQDLDGVSRFDEVERAGHIARRLYSPTGEEARSFELLLLFHGLGKWLERMGNMSRTLLAIPGLTDAELRQILASIQRLEHPLSEMERAVAAGMLVDAAGLRGLVQRFISARREGLTVVEVVREEISRDAVLPEWMPPRAAEWIAERRRRRLEFCEQLLNEDRE